MERAAASDAELIDASRRGERDAFGVLVERYATLVEAVSYASTRDRSLGEDVAQDTFVAAWRELDRLRDTAAVRPWLCGIARNLARKARRRRIREVPERDVVTLRTPFDVLREGQAERLVAAALERVPEADRETLVLFYYEQRSTKDVAETLGITENAVHQRLSRGRKHLAAELEDSVERVLEGQRSRRNLAAAVLAALPLTLAVAPSHAEAATKGSSMWKIGLIGMAGATLAAGTVLAWPREPRAPRSEASHAEVAAPTASPNPPALPAKVAKVRASDAPGDCDAVGRHMLDLAIAQVPPPADVPIDDTGGVGGILRTQFAQGCREAAWSQSTIACVMAADDMWNAMLCDGATAMPALPAPAPANVDASCAAVAAHALVLMDDAVAANVPQSQRAAMATEGKGLIEGQCKNLGWTETQRRCAIAATSPFQLGACTMNTAPPQVTPAPSTADASCAAVGKHMAALQQQPIGEDALPGVSEEVRKAISPASPDLATQAETACTNGQWSESMRRCLLGTKSTQDFAACQRHQL